MIKTYDFDPQLLEKVDSFVQKAKRPDNSSLNTEKIKNLGKHKFRDINHSFQFLKQSKSKAN